MPSPPLLSLLNEEPAQALTSICMAENLNEHGFGTNRQRLGPGLVLS
jgi:hypothetical protein